MTPSSPRLSSSSSSSSFLPTPLSWEHDVFLCFRGEDTREGFTGYLYHALTVNSGINTFMDVRLSKGTDISELLDKIERSRIAVVIFSPNFASSRWCLDELDKIMHCHRNTAGYEVLPIFYKVAPNELRGPKGKTAEYLTELAKGDPEKAEKWKLALEEFSYLTGWTFMQGTESELITEIADEVKSRVDRVHIALEVDMGEIQKTDQQIYDKFKDVAVIVHKVIFLTVWIAFVLLWIRASIRVGFWSSMWNLGESQKTGARKDCYLGGKPVKCSDYPWMR